MKIIFILIFFVLGSAFSKDYYCVQLASSRSLQPLKEMFKKVLYLPDLRIEKIGQFYTLRAGLFTKRESANKLLNRSKLVFGDSFVRVCSLEPDRIVIPNLKNRKRRGFFTYQVGMKLASLYLKKKDFEKAEKIYRELSQLYPDSKEIKLQLARVLYWQGKYEESLKLYRELEIFDPKIAKERRKVEISRVMKRVEELEKEGKLEEAIKLLEELYREERGNYDVGMRLGKLYIKVGKRKKANKVFASLLSKYGNDKDIRYLYEITKANKVNVKKNFQRGLKTYA